ncbi:MFS transporter [Kitasatospora acidiphila]|uniref:MFS transporter n=1 Tax=Kitasatospora acidiphila TaxID=2567942 RepID=UPI0015F1049B|nr:MFS transporter [Kitasatospora acidiphila]
MTNTQLAPDVATPGAPSVRPALPAAFRRLWAASAVSSLGDGVYFAALPLLAATLTQNPVALGMVASAALLPWLFFGLLGGALVDRWDRRRTMWITDLLRAVLLAIPALAAVLHLLSIPLLVAVAFLLGTGQIFFDSAGSAYLPQLLGRDLELLQQANSRQMGARTVAADFAGPPAGSALFALTRSLPFGLDALSFLASSLLIRTLPAQPPVRRQPQGPSLWAEAKTGAAFLFKDKVLLGLALRPAIGNMAFAGMEAVLVLFAHHQLHLGNVGYGVLLTAQAVGGLLGAALAGRLGKLLGTGRALTTTALLEAAALIGLGLSAGPLPFIPAGLALALLGAAMAATMVLAPSVSQALIPGELAGRVGAARRLMALGAAPVGALLGGWLAQSAGLRAPFLVGALLLASTAVLSVTLASNKRIEAALAAAAGAAGE